MADLLQTAYGVLNPLAPGGAHYAMNDVQPPVLPYIVFRRIVSTTNNTLAGATDLQNTRLQVDVYARTVAETVAIGNAITATMASAPWPACVQLTSADLFEPDTRLYRSILEFSVWSVG
ncbi:DUF3168 domain-containing protein [Brachymonas sp.]|uniref:DUF3168 domain-containing protein n=1 Tax=Brachymonas sp. TaxID=1936292 RepID=UPI0035B4A187